MSQTIWGPLRVHDFFSSYNWTGIAPKLEPLELLEERVEPSSWLCLKMGDFLQQANWRGKPSSTLSQTKSTVVPKLSVTLSVGEFFTGMNWVSSQRINVISSKRPTVVISPSEDLNVNQLSNLF